MSVNVYNFLGASAFWLANKHIAKATSIEASVLLSDLISKREYFIIHHDLVDGKFFNTVENIKIDTGLSKYQQSKALSLLVKMKFISVVYEGIPKKRFFIINDKKIIDFMAEREETERKKSKNLTSSGQKTLPQEVKKLDTNNNTLIKTQKENKINNTEAEFIFSVFEVCEHGGRYPLSKLTQQQIDFLVDRYGFVTSMGTIHKF